MDRTAWIVVALCVVGLVVWEIYLAKQMAPRPAPLTATPGQTAPTTTPSILTPSPSPVASPETAPQATESGPSFAEKIEALRNSDVELRFTNRGGGIAEAVMFNHIAEGDQRVTLNSPKHTPIGAIVDDPAKPALPEFTLTRESDSSMRCERTAPDGITVRKKFSLLQSAQKKDDFLIELNLIVQNTGSQPHSNTGYFVALGSAAPIHPKDYPYYTRLVWSINGKARDKNVSSFQGSGGFLGIGAHAAQPVFQENFAGAEWTAVTDQFFATIIAPLSAKATGIWGRSFDVSTAQNMVGIEGAMRMPGFQVQPGQTYTARFQIWAGPKIYHRLAQLEQNQAEIMNFGMFKIVSQFLLNFLNTIHGFVKDYGVAILVLTLVVRLVLWPLQSKANQTMRKTALLGPKMQELREKFKDDPTRMNQEVMKLYKQYGINPVGGCLPMAIQIPIFFGLYQMLAQAVELRNARFLWVHDLSQPDTVAHLPVLGWPINIIPLLMAATQIWLMAMTPKTGDPTQRRIMMFTPLIFLFFCYNFAAALALYYTAQNLFSILQFYQNKRQPMPTLEKVAPAGKRKR
ncbi:MAG TPA: membrane protein insertase YidC [Candidatus Udaeobacter sp.]|jgi:YidC/Oxa1 family membrane protein insertase|nr:membrane protein insertase YidC [Candidatus Udaeobacter sp.]